MTESNDIADYLRELDRRFREKFYEGSPQEEVDWDKKHGFGSWRSLKNLHEALSRGKFPKDMGRVKND